MNARILIVDDQKGVRSLLEEVFRKEGCQVMSANDGLQAIDCVRSYRPELVLMDFRMPHMNGLEAAVNILSFSTVPIIMMTAYGETEIVNRAIESGVKACITKPFDLKELRELVQQCLLPVH